MKNSSLNFTSFAAVVHIYYLDLWPEISEFLKKLPSHAIIFITTSEDKIFNARKIVLTDFPNAKIYGYPNRGRDLGPLLELMKVHRLEDFDLVLKIHGKKSPHLLAGNKDLGEFWRRNYFNKLIPDWGVEDVVEFFDRNPHVGIGGPSAFLTEVGSSMYSQGTHDWFSYLLQKLGYPIQAESELFFAGTMFWARGLVFGALRSLGVQQSDIDLENRQTDGTLAHALERFFPVLAKSISLHTKPFPLWDYRSWLQERKPLLGQVPLINSYLSKYGGGPHILMVIIDREQKNELVESTLKSLQIAKVWGLNVNSILLKKRSELKYLIRGIEQEWFFVVEAGTELTTSGLLLVVQKILQNPTSRAIYADEMTVLPNGKIEEGLRPDFNLDLLLSYPAFLSRHWLFKVQELNELIQGESIIESEWIELDLILRLIEKGGLSDLLHVPELLVVQQKVERDLIGPDNVILRHIYERNYLNAKIISNNSGMYRIEYGHLNQPLVSILIAVCDDLAALMRCVETMLSVTSYPFYEIIIVDNLSKEINTINWLESVASLDEDKLRVIRMATKSSRAQVFNKAVREARGEYLLILSYETSFEDPYWLNSLMNHSQRPEVAVVGPLLFHPDQQFQYSGFVLGLRSVVSRPVVHKSILRDSNFCRFQVDQNYSALPDTCFLTKRSVFEELGGFDEILFGDFYADSDFCLRAISAGYINVWTPHSHVKHDGYVNHESLNDTSPEYLQKGHEQQRENFFVKWIDLIAADPAYNPNYSLIGEGFSIDDRKEMFATVKDSRWSPLTWKPLPSLAVQPADRKGCGHYRIIQPFNALKSEGLVDGFIEDSITISLEMARLKSDILVTQNLISEERLVEFKKMKNRRDFFFIIDLDDYLINVPIKSNSRKYFDDKRIIRNIKEGLSFADRFIVSTPGLAEAFEGFHLDMRVAELKLPVEWWSSLHSSRNAGRRPRVGWAGGTSHTGDLQMIADVVKALSGEVDWVFFGMCPDVLRPWVKELHAGVPIELYPQKLASLNLDLAIAPLENNIFNDCKSNLRLLEYGACSYPVVCSDTRAYRESGLPVTIVKNRFRDWVAAIRMHINDLDEAQRNGINLRNSVLSNWMLSGSVLEQWRDNWRP
jgi:O-antigen biosynthesis protein